MLSVQHNETADGLDLYTRAAAAEKAENKPLYGEARGHKGAI